MEIYAAPEYLILHLKRFSHSRGIMGGGKKVGSLITFPVEGMDLSKYILKNSNLNEKFVYDLYAVSNHFGGLDGGHYTAFCRNPVLGKWYDCDDSTVTKMSASDVVTKAAYVLFYKRRQ
jgi:ubiquitin carboxyl-terminal hydrolase 4/11/15